MPELDPRYASPGLRWSLLLEDHPGAQKKFRLGKASEIGDFPAEYGGDVPVCIATILTADGRELGMGYKKCPHRGDPDDWNTLCTKTLGRALKAAGYPDHTPDLKAVVLWRQRLIELRRFAAGDAPLSLGTGDSPMEKALDAASTPDVPDEGEATPAAGGDDDIADAEVVPPPPRDEAMPEGFDRLPAGAQARVRQKAKERGWGSPAVTALISSLLPKLETPSAPQEPVSEPVAVPTPDPEAEDDDVASAEDCVRLVRAIVALGEETQNRIEERLQAEEIDLDNMPTRAQLAQAREIVLEASGARS